MAVFSVKPGNTQVQLTARARANTIPPELRDIPGGLYPLLSAAFEVDEYRIMAGWPVPIPEADIRIECLVSGEGTSLSDRPTPTGLITAADMRWVADVDYYDQTALVWNPLQSNVSPWQTSPEAAPTLVTDYEYQFGDERFTEMTALNFDSDTGNHMWIDLSLAMGGTSGYTVIMVMSPSSVYGNNGDVIENTLWGPDGGDSLGWVNFTVRDRAVWCGTEVLPPQKGVAIGDSMISSEPSYLAMVVGRPQTTIYAATGPSRVLVKPLTIGSTPRPLSTRFRLGGDPFPTSATMDMALLDLSIYADPLTKDQVVTEITELSKVYGGDT